MDIRKIKKLIELLEESDVEELEIHEGDDSVRISRRREQLAEPQYMAQYPSPAPQPASPQPSAPAADEPAKPAEPSGHAVKSPMVGTFYRSPSPTAKAFVEVGQSVKAGDVVCIVEAMKMEFEITASVAGTVTGLHCKPGTVINAGDPVVVIDTESAA